MSSASDRSSTAGPSAKAPPRLTDWLVGGGLLAAALGLLSIYAEGQLTHTVRFLFELVVYRDRILPF